VPPLRVGFLVDSRQVSWHIRELARMCDVEPLVELSHLFVQCRENSRPPFFGRVLRAVRTLGLRGIAASRLWKLINRIEARQLKRTFGRRHLEHDDVSSLFSVVTELRPLVSASGFIYRFTEEDIERIKSSGCDVLIRCGSGILRGAILDATPHGVLSFHHGDNRINRGGPAGFWEVLEKQPATGFIIQRLTAELDGGAVLVRGAVPTKHAFLLNQAAVLTRSNKYMIALLRRVAASGSLPPHEIQTPYPGPLYRNPSIRAQATYLGHRLARTVRRFGQRGIRDSWGVAYARSDWRTLVMRRATRLTAPPGMFIADPFVVAKDGKDYCFVEEYSWTAAKGHIAVYDLSGDQPSRVGVALDDDVHLSFPFTFWHEGRLFLIPESSAAKEIRLYECEEFPLQWKLCRVLLANLSAADSMMVRHDDRWWLLTNIDPEGGGEHSSELHAFYSDDLLAGTWIPHDRNPIVADPAVARNGGVLQDTNGLFRVAQQHGFLQYGTAFTINQIVRLSPTEYREDRVARIPPTFSDTAIGTHHLHSNGRVTAFDFLERIRG
jgi:hypothetical protein